MMKYGVVIVTFNRKQLLRETIEAMLNQSLPPHKIIIVDNNSSDGTQEQLKKDELYNNSVIKPIYLDRNVGGAGGFKTAIEEMLKEDVDWISISDDDAIFDKYYFENMKNGLIDGEKAYCGSVYYPDNTIQLSHRRRYKYKFSNLFDKYVKEEEYKKEKFDVDLATFVGLFVSREVIQKIGLPKEDYFIWLDDFEYCMRITKETQQQIHCITDAKIIHKVDRFLNKEYELSWKEYYGCRNKFDIIENYSRNTFEKNVLIKSKVIVNKLNNLFNPKYSKVRKERAILVSDAFKDFNSGNFGISEKYYPGRKF